MKNNKAPNRRPTIVGTCAMLAILIPYLGLVFREGGIGDALILAALFLLAFGAALGVLAACSGPERRGESTIFMGRIDD